MKTSAEYKLVHDRVRKKVGRASTFFCWFCPAKAKHWAYDGACPEEKACEASGLRYTFDLRHYFPLCVPCHRAFDTKDECPNGHGYTEENTYWVTSKGTRKCKECARENRSNKRVTKSPEDDGRRRYRAGITCPVGHLRTDENTYWVHLKSGTHTPKCRACDRDRHKQRRRTKEPLLEEAEIVEDE